MKNVSEATILVKNFSKDTVIVENIPEDTDFVGYIHYLDKNVCENCI